MPYGPGRHVGALLLRGRLLLHILSRRSLATLELLRARPHLLHLPAPPPLPPPPPQRGQAGGDVDVCCEDRDRAVGSLRGGNTRGGVGDTGRVGVGGVGEHGGQSEEGLLGAEEVGGAVVEEVERCFREAVVAQVMVYHLW